MAPSRAATGPTPGAGFRGTQASLGAFLPDPDTPAGRMSVASIVLFVLIAAMAAFVQTMTGFAFGLIMMGAIALFGLLTLTDAATLIGILVLVNAAQMLLLGGWRHVALRSLGLTLCGTLPAILVGYALLEWLADTRVDMLKMVLGLVIMASSLQVAMRPEPLPRLSPPGRCLRIGATDPAGAGGAHGKRLPAVDAGRDRRRTGGDDGNLRRPPLADTDLAERHAPGRVPAAVPVRPVGGVAAGPASRARLTATPARLCQPLLRRGACSPRHQIRYKPASFNTGTSRLSSAERSSRYRLIFKVPPGSLIRYVMAIPQRGQDEYPVTLRQVSYQFCDVARRRRRKIDSARSIFMTPAGLMIGIGAAEADSGERR